MVTIATGQVAGNSKDGKVMLRTTHPPAVSLIIHFCVFLSKVLRLIQPLLLSVQPLPPHIRVWDSVTLNTLHVIGMGVFDRAVTCVAFSKSVSRSASRGGPEFNWLLSNCNCLTRWFLVRMAARSFVPWTMLMITSCLFGTGRKRSKWLM